MIRQESEAGCHSVKKMCDLLDVSKATYYRKINFKPSKRALERDLLDERFLRIYHESDRIYGAGKSHYLLTQKYQDYRKTSMKRVQQSMKRQTIQSITIKKFKAEKSSKKILKNYKNIANQGFSTTGLNQKWVADIPYIHTLENGWC